MITAFVDESVIYAVTFTSLAVHFIIELQHNLACVEEFVTFVQEFSMIAQITKKPSTHHKVNLYP